MQGGIKGAGGRGRGGALQILLNSSNRPAVRPSVRPSLALPLSLALALVRLALALAVALALALALVRELLSKNLKMFKISKVLRMGLPIVENLSGLSGNILNLFNNPQLHLNSKSKK